MDSSSPTVIQVRDLSKQYRLGLIGGGTLQEDVQRWWAKLRGRPDPTLELGTAPLDTRDGRYVWALRDLDFDVRQGEVLGIIGKNGAGKSTLLKLLSRITAPTSGEIRIRGRTGSLLEVGTGFHPELTGRENVYLNGAILGMKAAEVDRKFDEIVDFSGVEQYIDTPVKRYSSGMRVRLAFAVAAHLDPEILIIDEVLAVGDLEFQRRCVGKMGEVAEGGRTVLFVSHQMPLVRSLCSRVIWLAAGRLRMVAQTDDLVDAYEEASMRSYQGKDEPPPLPLANTQYGVSLEAVRVWTVRGVEGHDLHIRVRVSSEVRHPRISIGVGIHTDRGEFVTRIGPAFTKSVIPELMGPTEMELACPAVSRYLAMGRYALSVYVGFPQVARLITADQIARFEVPFWDHYGTGRAFERIHYGLVPLPLEVVERVPHREPVNES